MSIFGNTPEMEPSRGPAIIAAVITGLVLAAIVAAGGGKGGIVGVLPALIAFGVYKYVRSLQK